MGLQIGSFNVKISLFADDTIIYSTGQNGLDTFDSFSFLVSKPKNLINHAINLM